MNAITLPVLIWRKEFENSASVEGVRKSGTNKRLQLQEILTAINNLTVWVMHFQVTRKKV